MAILNEIFSNWTSILTPDIIKITFGLMLVVILVLIFIDNFYV